MEFINDSGRLEASHGDLRPKWIMTKKTNGSKIKIKTSDSFLFFSFHFFSFLSLSFPFFFLSFRSSLFCLSFLVIPYFYFYFYFTQPTLLYFNYSHVNCAHITPIPPQEAYAVRARYS